MTPEIQDRNPFVPIGALVIAMALAAGLAARYGVNNLVVAVCAAIAVVGTWVLLTPQIETLETHVPAGAGSPSGPGKGTVSAFASNDAPARQKLRARPRASVGFETADSGTKAPPARLPSLDHDPDNDVVAPVQALGQLPLDAAALVVSTTVEPASNVSGAYTLSSFEVRAASRRGSDHVILDEPRQDDYVVASAANGRYLVVVVADGVAIAEHAHFGAYWASRLLAQAIDQHLRDGVPGIDKMLERTRQELSELFDMRFTDGTKMRTIATTLVGLIAPVDGGPAAGFRVGDSDILVASDDGWTSLFGAPAGDAVFPRSVEAEVAALEFDPRCLLLASDGVAGPMLTNARVASATRDGLAAPVSEVEFDQLMSFPLEEARGDRTAVAVWFTPR